MDTAFLDPCLHMWTKNVVKLVDESLYQGRVAEQLLFDSKRKVGVEIITDSEPLLDSIGSTKQVEKKMLREVMQDMKEKLSDWEVENFRCVVCKKFQFEDVVITHFLQQFVDLQTLSTEDFCIISCLYIWWFDSIPDDRWQTFTSKPRATNAANNPSHNRVTVGHLFWISEFSVIHSVLTTFIIFLWYQCLLFRIPTV